MKMQHTTVFRDEVRIEVHKKDARDDGSLPLGAVAFPFQQLVKGLEANGAGEGWYTLRSFDEQSKTVSEVTDLHGRLSQLFLRLKYLPVS